MSDSRELTTRGQQSLDDQIFSRFINLKVAVSLSGSQQFPAEELLELAGEGRLEKGREVTVTARFFVAESGLGVTRREEYGGKEIYGFGSGKVGLKLVRIESLQVGEQKLSTAVAKLCECAVRANGDKQPDGYRKAQAEGWVSWHECKICGGGGLLYPKKYDAPHAQRDHTGYNETLILVDELPEPKPVPDGHCPQCGEDPKQHAWKCPEHSYYKRVREELEEAEEGEDVEPIE